jgi:hypothetical protein
MTSPSTQKQTSPIGQTPENQDRTIHGYIEFISRQYFPLNPMETTELKKEIEILGSRLGKTQDYL